MELGQGLCELRQSAGWAVTYPVRWSQTCIGVARGEVTSEGFITADNS